MKKKILIIDDDIDMCLLLARFLERNGYETDMAHSGMDGIEKFKRGKFEVVISDYRLGDIEGKDVLKEIKAINAATIVLIITGYSDIKIALDIIQLGAHDYITKPLIPTEVLNVLDTALNQTSAGDNIASFPEMNKNCGADREFVIGQSKIAKDLYRQIEIVAGTDYNLILYGEKGTGKKQAAQAIHCMGKRKDKSFVIVDCAALSKDLSGSEFLGSTEELLPHFKSKIGFLELANGGTILLDEVFKLPNELQFLLLKVLQENKFRKVGSDEDIHLDLRVIATSTRDLQEVYQDQKLIEDLYHRLNEYAINLLPLRNRNEDIDLFVDVFFQKTTKELNKKSEGFDEEVRQLFLNYAWPGNLRELKNVVRRSILVSGESKISLSVLPQEIAVLYDQLKSSNRMDAKQYSDNNKPLKDTIAKAEYEAIMKVLKEVNFNKTRAAEILNVDRKTLYNKIKLYEGNISDS